MVMWEGMEGGLTSAIVVCGMEWTGLVSLDWWLLCFRFLCH